MAARHFEKVDEDDGQGMLLVILDAISIDAEVNPVIIYVMLC